MTDEFENKENGFERSFDMSFDDNNWIVGLALIVIGGLFLLDSFGIMSINLVNWWAIFILIPGLMTPYKPRFLFFRTDFICFPNCLSFWRFS